MYVYIYKYIYFKNIDYKGNKQDAEVENSRGTYLNREVRGAFLRTERQRCFYFIISNII